MSNVTGDNEGEASAWRAIYYGAVVDAWFETRMEKDRALLTLSAGGVALLATFMTATTIRSMWHWAVYLAAAFSFVVAMVSAILIFGRNATYLGKVKEEHEKNRPAPPGDSVLRRLDRALRWSFILGVGLTLLAAAIAAWPNARGRDMADKTPTVTRIIETTTLVKKSYEGAGAMQSHVEPKPTTPATPTSPDDSAANAGSSSGSSGGGGSGQSQ
jgi:multisubunit Na+/H+ antiporter MnhG subunit